MGDIARCSAGKYEDDYNEDLLYQMFGINAELLIDHAWGIETCTIKDIKAYRPSNHSCGIGQVLSEPYTYEKGKIFTFDRHSRRASGGDPISGICVEGYGGPQPGWLDRLKCFVLDPCR